MESKLPDEVQDQINQEAFNKSLILKNERRGASFCLGYEAGYVEGATEWAIWKVKHDQLKEELRQSQLSVTSLRYSLDQRDRQLFELKDKAEKMEAALREIIKDIGSLADGDIFEIASKAIQQWNDGKKEATDPCPNCGKELSRDRNLCCRECGKEVERGNANEIEYMPIHPEDLKYTSDLKQIPMCILSEQQADKNHGQSLQRLKERGGLSVREALSLITLKNWSYYRDLPIKEAVVMLNDLINNPN